MDENYRAIEAVCPTGNYQARYRGVQNHHDIDWNLRVNVDGHEPLENMTAAEISELVRTEVEAAAADSFVGMTKTSWEAAPGDQETTAQVAIDYRMRSERQTALESKHQPFIQQFDFEGAVAVDTRSAVSEDQGWLLAKRELAFNIANKITDKILVDVNYLDKADGKRGEND